MISPLIIACCAGFCGLKVGAEGVSNLIFHITVSEDVPYWHVELLDSISGQGEIYMDFALA